MSNISFELPLLQWSEWDANKAAQTGQSLPPLSFVEPMLRRRLSSLAKMSLWVAHECAQGKTAVRMIYASRHGELNRTTEMLVDLADKQALSPTAFSMSVLNASVGLYSMIESNTAPAIAISAGADTFAAGLLEAHLQLQNNPDSDVLLIYADEAVPEILQPEAVADAEVHALALLFKADEAAIGVRMQQREGGQATAELQSRVFVRGLLSRQQVAWQAADAGWTWGFA